MATVYRNARLDGRPSAIVSAIVIEREHIAWLGPDDALGAHDHPEIDLAAAIVTPAFVDAHVHTTATGISLTGLDLSTARSAREVLDAVAAQIRVSRGRPIIGSGWDETRWDDPHHDHAHVPTAHELDRAAFGGAVYLARVDGHSALASSALAAAVPGLAGLSGYGATGWHTRDAHDALRQAAFASLSDATVRDLQRHALQHAASLGIGCVHEMAGPAVSSETDLAGLLALAAAEALPRVIGHWGELHGVDTARRLGAVGASGDLFCDGSLGSHTAALREPYADRPDSSGALRYDTAELVAHIRACIDAGLQAGFHVIGDAAIDQVLDAFEEVSRILGRSAGAGHCIEHVEFVRDPKRLAASGLIASMQPMFDALWGGSDGMYAERLGPARAAGLNRFADLAAAGVAMRFGSDAPVTPLGPWQAVRAAAYPHDRAAGLPVRQALAAHLGADLVAGGPATFAAWDAASLDLGPDSPAPSCLRTVVDGVTVFDAAS